MGRCFGRLLCAGNEDAPPATVTPPPAPSPQQPSQSPTAESALSSGEEPVYTEQLAEPPHVGTLLVVTGTPSDDHPWFSLSVGCGDQTALDSGRGDVALHVSVRVPQRYVVRNTRRALRWGQEETTSYRSFPFEPGRPFALEALVAAEAVLLAVDGVHYCSYRHRAPSSLTAAWVQLRGVRDATLTVAPTATHYPALGPPPLPLSPATATTTAAPHAVVALPDGVPEGHQIIIQGRVRRLLQTFSVEVCEAGGEHEWPRAGVALHAEVRAREEVLVLNSRRSGQGGGWGEERRQRCVAFLPGARVDIRLSRLGPHWQVCAGGGGGGGGGAGSAGGALLAALEHRTAPDLARVLRVRGDLLPDRIYVAPV